MEIQKDKSEELIEKLIKEAKLQAIRNNYVIDEIVEFALKNFIATGIQSLSQSQLRDNITLRLAEENINYLVNLMSKNARSRRVNESLDITSLSHAMSAFCPRFPFC